MKKSLDFYICKLPKFIGKEIFKFIIPEKNTIKFLKYYPNAESNYSNIYDIAFLNNIMIKKKERIPLNLRRRVIERDGKWCVYCDEDLSDKEIHMDHVIAESKGGETTYNNLQVTCRKCNLAKGSLTESEFVQRLRTRAMNILNRIGAG